jgi:hypothetical protein
VDPESHPRVYPQWTRGPALSPGAAAYRQPVSETASRRGWRGIAEAAAVTAIAVGAAVAIYADRATIASGAADLAHLRLGRVGLAICAECVSMVAFALLNKYLLGKSGVTGPRITVRQRNAGARAGFRCPVIRRAGRRRCGLGPRGRVQAVVLAYGKGVVAPGRE